MQNNETIIVIGDLEFETNYIDDVRTGDAENTEYIMRCHTTNEGYILLAKEFENDNDLYENDFYFGIIKNETTKRFKSGTCRLFYLNIHGDDTTIDGNLNPEKYNEIIKKIKEYVKLYY